MQTNQGTMQIYGGWVTLYNTANNTSAFFHLFANSQQVFQASLSDAGQMKGSME